MAADRSDIDPGRAIPSGLGALEALARRAFELEPLSPSDARGVLRPEAALLLDRLITRVARSRGALDVALGDGLAAMAEGDRVLRLGYSGLGDYARERLGIARRTAQDLARLARELRERPLLAAAVRSGEVSGRKAQTILPVARGEDEAAWVERARLDTVRALGAAVRAAGSAPAEDEVDERWDRVWVAVTPEQRARFEEAMALAGRVLGATAPRWQRLEAICSEYLGTHGGDLSDVGEGAGGALFSAPVASWGEEFREALELETRRWAFLDDLSPVAAVGAPPLLALEEDPLRLDAALRELGALRDRWDEVLGHLAMLLRMFGLWRDMKFATLGQYCAERLGMAGRTLEQRAWLARRCYELPGLREALREKRISYEKARAIAGCADQRTIERWIDRAAKLTCVELQREAEAHEETQMCAPGELRLRLPRRVVSLLAAALRAAREDAGAWLEQGACLERVATHFIDTWQGLVPRARTPEARAIERDRGLCQVPGCSRAAVHGHHVVFRSRGGGDEPENLTALCAAHHLAGVHRGYLCVRGRAPDRLSWDAPALPS